MLYYLCFIILVVVLFVIFIYNQKDEKECDNDYDFIIDPKYAFTKSLRHNQKLICNKNDYKEFMDCLKNKKLHMSYFGNMKMVSISSAFNKKYDHLFKNIRLPNEYRLYSNLDNDMLELYGMSLCRDIPFKEYNINNELINITAYELKQSLNKLFRVTYEPGFYISQFIYYPHMFMGKNIVQKYKQYITNKDYGITEQDVIDMQNGFVNHKQELDETERYVINGRDLSKYVYVDNPLVYAQMVHSILSRLKVPLKFNTLNEQLFIDSGIIDFHALATDISRIAMIKCWQLKYKYCLLRPEVYGFHFNKFNNGNDKDYKFSESLINSNAVMNVFNKQNNYLLSQTYAEGSPCHPSYPAGHSTFIGAIVTVFKAFYDEDYEIDELIPNDDGTELINTGNKVKVGDELNKLASNVSIGRSFAGVHYRMDGDGLYLGQEVAINYLKERSKEYKEIKGLHFKDLDGKQRII